MKGYLAGRNYTIFINQRRLNNSVGGATAIGSILRAWHVQVVQKARNDRACISFDDEIMSIYPITSQSFTFIVLFASIVPEVPSIYPLAGLLCHCEQCCLETEIPSTTPP